MPTLSIVSNFRLYRYNEGTFWVTTTLVFDNLPQNDSTRWHNVSQMYLQSHTEKLIYIRLFSILLTLTLIVGPTRFTLLLKVMTSLLPGMPMGKPIYRQATHGKFIP